MTAVDAEVVEETAGGAPAPATSWRDSPVVPVVAALVLAALLHVLWWLLLANAGGDMAAQDAWADFAREHPDSAYNFAWYGGMHPVSYSVLSSYLMAAIGVRSTMMLAGTLSAGLLAALVARPGRTLGQRLWPALYGALALVGNAVSGRVTFAEGAFFGLLSLCIVFVWPQRWRHGGWWRLLRGALVALTALLATAASPVAGLFLGLVAAALWLAKRRAAAYALGLPPVLVVVASAALFPFSGTQPMSFSSAILPAVIGLSVLLLAPQGWRLLRLGGGVDLVAVLLAWLIPSAVGTNISRLSLIFGGVALVAIAVHGGAATSLAGRWLGRRGGQVLLVLAILTSSIWQVSLAARDLIHTTPPAAWTVDPSPLIAQLKARNTELGRVEVVPTRSHREASALAPYVNLARGWNRQADAERNKLFYRKRPLTPEAYRRWLHRWAVQYVVLSNAAPDFGAVEEDALVRQGLPYLEQVWSNPDWSVYKVRRPTPLVSEPAGVLKFDAAELVIFAPRAGDVQVRIPDSPWLSLVDQEGDPLPGAEPSDEESATAPATPPPGACLTHLDATRPLANGRARRDDWVVLRVTTPGVYRIASPYKLPRGSTCPSPE